MEAASIARLALRWTRARTATSGLQALTRRRTLGTCPSTVATSTQRTTTISPTVIPSAAKYITPKFPFTLTYGGNVNQTSGSTLYQDTDGAFWSIGADTAAGARRLYFDGSYISPENYSYKPFGFSVRSGRRSQKICSCHHLDGRC